MRTLLLGGFGLGFSVACLSRLIVPVCEVMEPETCEVEDEAYLRNANNSKASRSSARRAAAQMHRTVKASVWTAGVAHSPRRPFESRGVTPTYPLSNSAYKEI